LTVPAGGTITIKIGLAVGTTQATVVAAQEKFALDLATFDSAWNDAYVIIA
jgi:hypothetical protein